MDFKLVIFDFDGTLADTRKLIVICKQETMSEMGIRVLSEEECASTIGLSAATGFKQSYPDMSEEMIDKCVALYRAKFEEKKLEIPPELFPGVAETLEALKEKGIVCTIASARNSKSLKGFLSIMDIEKYFPYTLGGDDTELLKPHPEPVLKTLKELGIPAEDTLVVGDMPYDVLMGKNAGTYACGVTYGNSSREELVRSGADYVVDNIQDILNYCLSF